MYGRHGYKARMSSPPTQDNYRLYNFRLYNLKNFSLEWF